MTAPWTTLTLQTTTPLFNAGADPDGREGISPGGEAGIRVPSIRGAMRFWFRALAGCVAWPELDLVASLEKRVFGSAAESSPVILRIPEQPPVVAASGPHRFIKELGRDNGRWIIYLMGQGLGDLANVAVRRPYVGAGEAFQLRIRFRHAPGTSEEIAAAVESLAFASLWLACAYGGVGSRVRRGFGGLRITAAEGPLPEPWDAPGAILAPAIDHYKKLQFLMPSGPLVACIESLKALARPRRFDAAAAWNGGPPSFPVLSRIYAPVAANGGERHPSWAGTLSYAGEQLRHFRANEDYPGAGYQPRRKSREWAGVVHGDSDHFGLGALGLPVVYRDGYVVNADRPGSAAPLRRASPLWLRAVGDKDEWRLLSFAFTGAFLPSGDDAGVHLWRKGNVGRRLQVADDDVATLAKLWIDTMRADKSFIDGVRRP